MLDSHSRPIIGSLFPFPEYEVTAFVRDPARLPQELLSQVTTKTGDVLDSKAVDEAVQGQDAVVILLGTRNDLSE